MAVRRRRKANTSNSKVEKKGKVEQLVVEEVELSFPVISRTLAEEVPLTIGLVYFLTPLVVGAAALSYSSLRALEQVALISAWHVWCVQLALWPAPFSTLWGSILSMVTLVGGVYVASLFENLFIRQQYVMASMMFAFGRGNALANNPYLVNLPHSFRLAYVFSFLDLGKANTYTTAADRDRAYADLKQTFASGILAIAATSAALTALSTWEPHEEFKTAGLAKETAKITLGAIHFMLGLYIGDAIYTFPLFWYAKSHSSTLRPQPLMIRPWRSKTLKEWWGTRFDTGMQSVLYYNAYKPARALGFGRGVAMAATFALSGLIHCPMVYGFGAPLRDVGMMFLFFLLQAVLVGLEEAFLWGPSQPRTLILLALSSPLFVYPVLGVMGHHPLSSTT